MIIDAHSHVHDPLDAHLAALDDAGVDRTVLFPTRPHPERATDLASLHREMSVLDQALAGGSDGNTDAADDARYATAWRELDEALAAHPGRFLGFGSVRLGRPAAETAAAVARDVVGRGLYGIGELTPPPHQAALVEPVLQAAQDHGGLPVVVHGYAPTTAADLRTLADLATRYPSVPLVISQLAGAHWMEAIELARATPNMCLELSTRTSSSPSASRSGNSPPARSSARTPPTATPGKLGGWLSIREGVGRYPCWRWKACAR